MITFTGDLYLGHVKHTINSKVLSEINCSEYIVSNFEAVLAGSHFQKRSDKVPNLQFSKACFDNYNKLIKVPQVYTIANNHIHDLGEKGAMDTLNYLNQYPGVRCTGIGDLNEANQLFSIISNDKVIALLPVSSDEPEVNSILASMGKVGVPDFNSPTFCHRIRSAKENSDFVIVLPHWGMEYVNYPSTQIRQIAKSWIDYGADIIIGHHPHVIQGKEQYKGKWIYYSLGNYIFPNFYRKNDTLKKWDHDNCFSIMLNVDFTDEIIIAEVGLFYDTKKLILKQSDEAVRQLKKYSDYLDTDKYDKKQYYLHQQNAVYAKLKNDFSWLQNIKRLILTQRKNELNIVYLLKRLFKRILRFVNLLR